MNKILPCIVWTDLKEVHQENPFLQPGVVLKSYIDPFWDAKVFKVFVNNKIRFVFKHSHQDCYICYLEPLDKDYFDAFKEIQDVI